MVFRSTTEMMAAVLPAVWGTTSASALEAGAAWAAAGVTVAGVGRPVRVLKGSAPSPDKEADMGVIKIKAVHERRAKQAVSCPVQIKTSSAFIVNHVSVECPQGSVGYCNGAPVVDAITCGDDCCTGYSPCVGFTGCVKKDGSCVGYDACYGAFAPNGIEDSCHGGDSPCARMGYDGEVGKVSNSCQGDGACTWMGSRGATVGEVSNSCHGQEACVDIGNDGGTVGEVSNSCHGQEACPWMGSRGATVGKVSNSCNGYAACPYMGSGGTVKSITDSCNSNEHHPCRDLSGVDIGHVVPFKRQWRMQKYRIESITECNDLCVNDVVGCSGVKWRQGVRKPCRIFKGRASGNCGRGDVCVDL